MAVFTMALFLGVALLQWFTGAVAGAAPMFGVETYAAVLGAIAVSLGRNIQHELPCVLDSCLITSRS